MAASYPYSQDQFIQHVDRTEYETAADLNAVQWAIQAIEAVLGFGPENNAANPLYSTETSTMYPTLAARVTAAEEGIAGGVVIDEAAGDVSVSNFGDEQAAGNSGKSADAKHKHGRESLNTTGTLIQPVGGTQAAGGSGKAADAAHAHVGVASLANGYGITLQSDDGEGHGNVASAVSLSYVENWMSSGASISGTPGTPVVLAQVLLADQGTWSIVYQAYVESVAAGTIPLEAVTYLAESSTATTGWAPADINVGPVEGLAVTLSGSKIVAVGMETTVYLLALTGSGVLFPGTIGTALGSLSGVTGLTAVRIA